MLDGVNVSSWARTQKAIATSSGESELYAMSVGAAEALALREVLIDIGLPTTVRLRCDSTAAMGTASRQGLGRMKHVQVRDLALQQWMTDGRLTYRRLRVLEMLQTFSRNMCPRMYSSLSSRTRQHVCWNVVLVCGQMEG